MKFSVLVITYNSKWEKLKRTLQSIVSQNMQDYEIVITDDGSGENHFEQVKEFLNQNEFIKYKLVPHEVNQGTVNNLISGLEVVEGKYVKFIGAGDALFGEHTLQKLYDFMESKNASACFGRMQGFKKGKNGEKIEVPFHHPFDLKAYIKEDNRRIRKNLILYSDNVSGAAICYRTDSAITYMKELQPYVKYEEDIFQVLAAAKNDPLMFLDDYIVWYEVGDGVSTQSHSKFEELLRQDVDTFYKMLYSKYPNDPFVKKRFQMSKLYRIHNLYLRTLIRFFVNPDAIRYLISSFIQRL